MVSKSLLVFLFFFISVELFAEMERRRDQYLSDPGYFVAPVPYALPGSGRG